MGDYFGPGNASWPVVVEGRGVVGPNAYRVMSATGCMVTVAHVEVRCMVPQGVGTEYKWSISVASQTSAPSGNTTS